jgi:hypothetical protein
MIFIIAGTRNIAVTWAKFIGLPPCMYNVITKADDLRGIINSTVLVHCTTDARELLMLRERIKGRNITLLGEI